MPRLNQRPAWSAPTPVPAPVPADDNHPGREPLLFLDLEASALAPESWPVELGIAWLAGQRIEARSTLIAPRRSWSMAEWCEGSARCHGIRPQNLADARPADLVAADTDGFAGYLVVSDNAAWDQLWLDRLRGERPRLLVHPLRPVAAERLLGSAADAFALALLRSRGLHRAGVDAARLARAWLAGDLTLPRAA